LKGRHRDPAPPSTDRPIVDIAGKLDRAIEALGSIIDGGPYAPRELDHRCIELFIAAEAVRAQIPAKATTASKPRKPSMATVIRRARAAGATSVTLPDGTTIHCVDAKPSDPDNPWLKKAKP
jgi:hypothetical protein